MQAMQHPPFAESVALNISPREWGVSKKLKKGLLSDSCIGQGRICLEIV
jgi:hypothetical protein